jgi:hypothetical protein
MNKSIILPMLFILTGLSTLFFQNCSQNKYYYERTQAEKEGDPLSCRLGLLSEDTVVGGEPLSLPNIEQNSWGFELSGAQQSQFSFIANNGGLEEPAELYIEIATYAHPDSFKIRYDTQSESGIVVFDVCRLITGSSSVATNTERPDESVIYQFGPFAETPYKRVLLPAGTTAVHFDFEEIFSGNYIAVWGLDGFSDSLSPLEDLEEWFAWVEPAPSANMPGDQNRNETGDPVHDHICRELTRNGAGHYGCYGPGNFRLYNGQLVPVFMKH